MYIRLIDTGYFYADGGAMFGSVPKTSWIRRYPANEKNGCVLAMRSVLVRTDCGRVILVDTGAGTKHLKQLAYYHFFDLVDLADELRRHGITPAEVTDVVLTHLHFDHCGYVTQQGADAESLSLSFPNARHWVSCAQWENFLHPNALEKDSYFIENMQAVADAGRLQLIDRDTELCAGVQLRLFDGHTPGQIVPYMQSEDRTCIFAGDVIPLAASLSPGWISAYDTCPLTSYDEKLRLLKEAADKNDVVIFCHDAYTHACTVKKVNGFYAKAEEVAL